MILLAVAILVVGILLAHAIHSLKGALVDRLEVLEVVADNVEMLNDTVTDTNTIIEG